MRIRFITFDHPTPIDQETLREIDRECNVQVNYTGRTISTNPKDERPSLCVYSVEFMESTDISTLMYFLKRLEK
jgi:hypothetical protein